MQLSVVVPTYNQAELLRDCLRSLQDQTLDPASYEIVVVDDGSTDRTGEVLEGFRARVKPLRLPANRGRSAARNAGVAAATARLVVFIDSDVVVPADFLHWHLTVHRRHGPGVVCRGPVVLAADARSARQGRAPRLATSPAFLDTANASVEKSALLRAGLFDESFPGYGWEDFEMGMRLKRLGIRRVFCRQALAYHIQPPSTNGGLSVLLRKEEERARSAVHFLRRHPTLETRWLIQATPVHRMLYWIASAGGLLRPRAATRLAAWLGTHGMGPLGHAVSRAALNWHYSNHLQAELVRAA